MQQCKEVLYNVSKSLYASTNNNVKSSIYRIIKMYIIATLYLLLFSGYTSPLFGNFMRYDSAIFMLVAKGINAGKGLYIEIFDHKGPILFWIEALGMRAGRIGVFLIQTIFLTIDLQLSYKTANLFCEKENDKYKALAAMLLILAYPLANGNLSEEYSLPFVLLALYLFLVDMRGNEEPSFINSYIYGVCFAILAFIRINNAITICGIVLYWIIVLCKRKKYVLFIRHICTGIGGIITISLPISLYFGYKKSLYDMLYATFLFNIRYGSGSVFLNNFLNPNILAHICILFFPLLVSALVFYTRIKGKSLLSALEMILLLNVISLLFGHGYNHYFTVAIPIILLMFIFSEKAASGCRNHMIGQLAGIGVKLVIGIYVILAVRIVALNIYDYYVDGETYTEYNIVKESFEMIPNDERNSVLGYEIPAQYYLFGDTLPCYKYGILQDHWSVNDPAIMEDFLSYIDHDKPRWILTEPDCQNEEFFEIMKGQYELVKTNDYICMYHLTEKEEQSND